MTREEAAERVCLLFGLTCAVYPKPAWNIWAIDREAVETAYREWKDLCPEGFTKREAHPELDDEAVELLVLKAIAFKAEAFHNMGQIYPQFRLDEQDQ